MLKKIKSFVSKGWNKGKAMLIAAVSTVTACALGAVASAAESGSGGSTGLDMVSVMETAGQSLQDSLMQLVKTMIPVIISIFSGAVVIFGVFTLIKLGKRIFGKVAG